jgi:outer membrane protein
MRAFVTTVALAVFGLTAAPAAQAETLADALAAAYKTSKLLDQNEALLRAQDEGVAQAVAAMRPVVNFIVQNQISHSSVPTAAGTRIDPSSVDTTFQLAAQMTIYDFGRSQLGVQVARETVLATRQALKALEQEVLLSAVDAYVNVGLQQEIVALRNNNVRVISQELQAAKDRFDVGEVTRTDVAIAEASLAAAQSGLAAAQGQLNVARERYKAVVGRYPGNLAALPPLPATARSLEEARAIALRSHPELEQRKHAVVVADLGVKVAQANFRPTIAGTLTLNTSAKDEDERVDSAALGLTLRQTLYAGGSISSSYRQAVAQRDANRAALAQAAITLGEAVGNAWSALDVAKASIAAGDLQIQAAQTAFEGVREEATLGARTTLDVLDAEQNLLDARATRATAVAQRYVGVYNLLSTMGLLSVEHLKLGVPTYDPEVYYNSVQRAPITTPQSKALERILGKVGGTN